MSIDQPDTNDLFCRIARVLGIDHVDNEDADTIAFSLGRIATAGERIAVALERIADNLDEAHK